MACESSARAKRVRKVWMTSIAASTIRRLREQSGRTVTDLARAAGISRQSLQSIESGKHAPSLATTQRIFAALGKSLAELDEPTLQ